MDKINKVKTTLKGGKTKRVAGTNEHPAIAGIPDVVGVVVVAVEPQTIIIVFDVEHVEVAVRVANA